MQPYGVWLDRHACCTGRRSWSAWPGSLGTALTRGALGREASTHPGGALVVLGAEVRQLSVPVRGLCQSEPNRMLGLFLFKAGPLGTPGLHPHHDLRELNHTIYLLPCP